MRRFPDRSITWEWHTGLPVICASHPMFNSIDPKPQKREKPILQSEKLLIFRSRAVAHVGPLWRNCPPAFWRGF